MTAMRPRGEGSIDDAAFVDRVMAAVAAEPVPTPARTFTIALRNRSLGDAVAALATAWHVATLRGRRIGPRVRMRSMALVLSVVAVLAMGGSFATAAAIRVVDHARSDSQGAVVDAADPDRHTAPANDQTDGDEAPATDEVADPDDLQSAPDPDADNAAEDGPNDADDDDDASNDDESEDVDDHDTDDADEANEPDRSDEPDEDEATEDHDESTSGDEAEDGSEHEEPDEADDSSEHEEPDEADDADDAGESEEVAEDGEAH